MVTLIGDGGHAHVYPLTLCVQSYYDDLMFILSPLFHLGRGSVEAGDNKHFLYTSVSENIKRR